MNEFSNTSNIDIVSAPTSKPGKASAFLANLWAKYGVFALCFAIPALIMALVYVAHSVYPIGDESVLVLDLNGQYVYFFEELYDIVRGDGSIFYSFTRSLGGEFLGIFAYYLASPLSFLTVLFPREGITETLLALLILKTALCGLTSGIYLRRSMNVKKTTAVIFSAAYALCGYAVVMQSNTMWIDGLIYLPLILLGVEQLIERGSFKLFTVTLALSILSNFYIGYMTCIFVVIYFFCRYFALTPEKRNPNGTKHHFLRTLALLAVSGIVAALISAVILLPTYYSLTLGKTTFTDPDTSLFQKFDFLDLMSKMYIGSYDNVRLNGLPFVYTGMLTFILLPLYFFSRTIRVREKLTTAVLMILMVLSFNTSIIDLLWHGMQYPIWFNYRYSFMLSFVFVIVAARVFEQLPEIGFRPVLASGGIIAVLLILLQKLGYENLPDLTAVWVSLIFIALYVCLTRPIMHPSSYIRSCTSAIIAIFMCLELFCAGVLNMIALEDDVMFSSRASYRDFIDTLRPVVQKIEEDDPSFYRAEKTIHRKQNDNAALNIRGVSSSTSTLNKSTLEFLNNIGLASQSNWSLYLGSTPMTDTLLGIKYIITDDPSDFPLYVEYCKTDKVTVMKNPYALSVAFGVDPALVDHDITGEGADTAFSIVNSMIAAMVGSDENLPYDMADSVKISTENCKTAAHVGYTKYMPEDPSKSCSVIFTITIESDDELYCHFPGDYPRKVSLDLNGKNYGYYYTNETCRVLDLGSFNVGDTVTLKLTLKEDNLFLPNDPTEDYFYYFDEEAFAKLLPELSSTQYGVAEFNDGYMTGSITVDDDKTLIQTTIPYDSCWKVYCDGQEVEAFQTLDSLLAFNLTPGAHELTLRYVPVYSIIGGAVSVMGVVAFAAMRIIEHFIKKKKYQTDSEIGKETV